MILKNTDRLLKAKSENNDFDSYGVLVDVNGDECFLHSENVNTDTYFDIASMGKVLVTSTLILKAVDEKKLSLDDTLQKFFDNLPYEKRNITLKQLLTHSSGIIRYEIPKDAADRGSNAVAEFILGCPLAYKPGTRYTYSCNGMIILGYILEKIYNSELEDIFNKKIKNPLGYTRSKFNIAIDEPNSAVCYRTKNLDGFEHPWDDENVRILKTSAGSGGQFFTVADLKKFANAVMDKSKALYSKNIFSEAEKNQLKNIDEAWGLGWLYVDEKYHQTGKLFPVGSFGHCGHTGTSMFFNREKKMYVIILTNATRFLNMKNSFNGYDYGIIEKMREDIHNAIFEDIKRMEI